MINVIVIFGWIQKFCHAVVRICYIDFWSCCYFFPIVVALVPFVPFQLVVFVVGDYSDLMLPMVVFLIDHLAP